MLRYTFHIALRLAALAALWGAASCIKDDTDDCDPADELLLFIKAVDTETGLDITSGGEAGPVELVLFDGAGRFIDTRIVDGADVAARRPVVLTGLDSDGLHISAWGNLGDNMDRGEPGNGMDCQFLSLKAASDGYDTPPDDLFFGFHKINPPSLRAVRSHEVVIARKNAKLSVTVRGLDRLDADGYYFVMETPGRGYGFTGIPVGGDSRIKVGGVFRGGDYVTPTPVMMIQSPDPAAVGPGEGTAVRLMGISGGADTEIAVADRDVHGNYIGLYPGRTTNVLIDLSSTGNISVDIVITDWNHVHIWPQW